jgi:hypothetical protein
MGWVITDRQERLWLRTANPSGLCKRLLTPKFPQSREPYTGSSKTRTPGPGHPLRLHECDLKSRTYWRRPRTGICCLASKDGYTHLGKLRRRRTVYIDWVKGHAGSPGNERADELVGKAVEMVGTVHDDVIRSHQTAHFGEIPRGEGLVGRGTRTPWRRGDPPPPQRSPCWTKLGTLLLEWLPKSERATGDRRCTSRGYARGTLIVAGCAKVETKANTGCPAHMSSSIVGTIGWWPPGRRHGKGVLSGGC